MNFLDLKSLLLVLTIYVTLFLSGQVTSTVIEDDNNDISWRNCSLNFTFQKEHRLFNKTIKNNRLIKLSINITWTDTPKNASRNNTGITKSTWFLATEEAGKDLLLLDDQFEVMSLGTLAISVGEVALTLKQIPENCLGELSEREALETISGFLLKAVLPERINDENYEEDEADTKYVCNGTLTGSGICCLTNNQGIITCMKLEENEWTEQFLNFVLVLSFFIIGQSVRLIPKSFYRDRYVEKRNIHTPLILNIGMSGQPRRRKLVEIADKDHYKKYKKYSSNFPNCKHIVIKAVSFFLDDKRFESQAYNTSAFENVSHDVLQMANDIFCKCNEDYSDFEGLKECCYYDIIHICLKNLFKTIFFLLFSSPLAIRLLFLYNFMDTSLKDRLQMNCILITYCLSVAILTFLVFSTRSFKLSQLKLIYKGKLKQSMDKAMAENFKTGLKNVGQTTRIFLRTSSSILYKCRFSRLSLAKAWLTIIIFCFPFYIVKSFYYIVIAAFPPLKFLSETLHDLNHFSKDLYEYFKSQFFIIIFIVNLVLLIFFQLMISAMIFLSVDVAVFFAKCCLYMTIGFLLNFDNLLVYFSFFVLISTYIFQCIQKVNTKIRNFNKELIKGLSKILESVEGQEDLNGSIIVKRDGIYFSTSQLSYFFKQNEHDKVKYIHVSRYFLNYLSSIPSPLTPGSRNWLYCKAFMEIVLMFLLLVLVVVIVVSYGNATDLSSGMKTLITLGSGALLFLFNNLLIRSFSHSKYEDDEALQNFIRSHKDDDIKELWEIHDFDNFSEDNTENNADLYCKHTDTHEMLLFTKESLMIRDVETGSLSVCDIFREIVCGDGTKTNSHETNTDNQMMNESDAVTERTVLLRGDHRMSVNLSR